MPVEHGAIVKKGDVIARLDSKDLQKELKKLIAERDKAYTQKQIAENQDQKSSNSQADQDMQYQIKSQLAESRLTYKSAKEQIEIVQEQIELMTIRAPQDGIITTWEVKKNLMGRPVEIGHELLNIAAIGGDSDWVLEVDVPDDDMGPVLAARSKLQEEIASGKKQPGAALKAYFVTATDPEHKYEGYVRRIAAKAETGGAEARRQGDGRLRRGRAQGLPLAEPGAPARVRGPGEDRLRQDPPVVLPAPQGRPGLVRVGDVPLAVPPLSSQTDRSRRPENEGGRSPIFPWPNHGNILEPSVGILKLETFSP